MASKSRLNLDLTNESNFKSNKPSLHSSSPNLSNETQLTSEEVDHLCSVMLRAKKFDEESLQSNLFEGQLCKYTNVVKGWQYRWFVIHSGRGTLEYYMLEDRKKLYMRGCSYLAGCQIIPSEEDSQTFTVNAACGAVYKLKASDAKNRQIWVNKLRLAAQMQESKAHSPTVSMSASSMNSKFSNLAHSQLTSDLWTSFDSVRDQLLLVRKNEEDFSNTIEDLTNSDEDLLIMKITANAALLKLEQCFDILESI